LGPALSSFQEVWRPRTSASPPRASANVPHAGCTQVPSRAGNEGALKLLKQFDDGIARGEAALAVGFLLTMIALGTIQALLRNVATVGDGIQWANDALAELAWIDEFLKKGTLWLAFLGASLATREEKHIAIDVLPRIASRKLKLVTQGLAAIGASAVSFLLARAFWGAILAAALERPADLEVWGDSGAMHVCDATPALAEAAQREVPGLFCAVRSALDAFGIPVETPWATFQLIVPVMFVIIATRLLANGIKSFLELGKPAPASVARHGGEG
jgi:TRAP-type C4-dicarboxylate transport system permease small subunit